MLGPSSRLSCHEGVRCDACSRADFRGKRYKCLICYDYDLCEACYEAEVTDAVHKAEHAVQCILTPMDYDLYYGGEAAEQPQSFTCPMCATMGFTLAGLREHVTSEHAETEMQVVCPVCAATPGGNPNHVTGDLAVHLALDHSRNRDILDDQSASRRLQRVSSAGLRGAIVSSARGRRPQRQLPSAVSLPPLSPPDTDSPGGISNLLSQVSPAARRQSILQAPGGTAAEIQHLRMRLQVARQQLQTAFQQQDRPRLRDPLPAATSMYSPPLARFPEPAAVRPKPVLVQPPSPDDARFLLAARLEPSLGDSQQQALEVERANRSLFVQELLLSTLEAQAPAGADGQCCEPKATAAVVRGAEQTPTARPESTAAKIPEKSAPISPEPVLTKSPEPVVTPSPGPTLVASQEASPPSSLEPTVATDLGLTASAGVGPTAPAVPGPILTTSREPNVHTSQGPTSTTSSGCTASESSIPIADGQAQGASEGATAPSSPRATVATSLGPTTATTLEATAAPTPDPTVPISPDAPTPCAH